MKYVAQLGDYTISFASKFFKEMFKHPESERQGIVIPGELKSSFIGPIPLDNETNSQNQ